ncbi:thioredoxin-like protein [Plectosphaerella plurivora]|uniref:Thioredoxin-like protein n=2 Tax=Plectosphaerella TaxID=40657 RepID=A0A9P9A710_9PEZI|nr:thioredoxin-like protein [Plectosphaerella plurivora]KAH7363519.1 thioredoxin-like protein [Plectosphaerella cucumerina]
MARIILYTAHHCPFAHRVQIAIRELQLPFEEELVDITVPRTKEFLAVNPAGMVPALSYGGMLLTESELIVKFLLDSHSSHLLMGSTEPSGPVQRFRMGFFIDTFFGKVHPVFDRIVYANGVIAKNAAVDEYVNAVAKHAEPLLSNATPFFGSAEHLTLVEVLTGPFLLRVLKYPNHNMLVPARLLDDIQQTAPKFWEWAQAVTSQPSVLSVWDEDLVVTRTLEKVEKQRSMLK